MAFLGCCLGQTTTIQPSVPSSIDNFVALLDDPTTVNGLEGTVKTKELVESLEFKLQPKKAFREILTHISGIQFLAYGTGIG